MAQSVSVALCMSVRHQWSDDVVVMFAGHYIMLNALASSPMNTATADLVIHVVPYQHKGCGGRV